MSNTMAFIESFEASLNLVQLPTLRLNKGGDCFSGEKRLGAACAPGERLEPFLGVGGDTDGESCRHLYLIVCNVYKLPHITNNCASASLAVADPLSAPASLRALGQASAAYVSGHPSYLDC